ncbi:MAG: hypothetical protein KUG70_02250 [Rhodobacteraceae bacterium]|nr:hypothetical protein [Paracoccaceae bacterium]
MKAVVHLGLSKTGTSTIQRWLMVNRTDLLKQGIQYDRFDGKGWAHPTNQRELIAVVYTHLQKLLPFERTRKNLGIQNFDDQLALSRHVQEVVESAAKENKNGTFLISSEHLGGMLTSEKQIQVFDGWLKSVFSNVRYVMFLRDPEHWLVSRYIGSIAYKKNPESIADFVMRAPYAGYRPLLERWQKSIDLDLFDLRVFEEKWKSEEGLIDDFSDALSIDNHGLKSVQRSNISHSKEENHAIQNGADSRTTNVTIWKRLVKYLRFLVQGSLKGMESTVKLTAEQQRLVWDKNREDISWIKKTFFEGKDFIFMRSNPNV